MSEEKFLIQRSAITAFMERMEMFDIFSLEETSSPTGIGEYYISEVQNSDLIILVLQEDLREGVVKEFQSAKRNKVRTFAYIHTGNKTEELGEFIRDEIQNLVTNGNFTTTKELIDKIERDLMEDVARTYKYSHKQIATLSQQFAKYADHSVSRGEK